jgi:hypothetical protein
MEDTFPRCGEASSFKATLVARRQAALKKGVLSMKNIFRSLAIIALAVAIGFSFAACSSKNSGGKSLNSTDDLKAYLDKQPANSPSKPIRVSMKANEMMLGNIAKVLIEAGKFVNLNLTGSPLTTVPDEVFNECKSLVGITIPNSVTSIGKRAFLKCTSLANITIPNSVTSIEQEAFGGCTSLASVTIPDSITSIEDSAFANCTSLASVIIGNGLNSIERISFLFTLPNLTAINVTKSNNTYSSEDGILYTKDKNGLVRYPAGKTGAFSIPNSVTSIEERAFIGCTNISSVTIGNSVTIIGEQAFSGCTSLASVTIGNGVIEILKSTFSDCSSLTSITITNSVTSIRSYAFYNCASLASITIPNSVTSIGNFVFYECNNLASVTIPDSITVIGGGAFGKCSSLVSVTFQGTIPWKGLDNYYEYTVFPGDLRAKFFATDRTNGTPGTYTRASGSFPFWVRQ